MSKTGNVIDTFGITASTTHDSYGMQWHAMECYGMLWNAMECYGARKVVCPQLLQNRTMQSTPHYRLRNANTFATEAKAGQLPRINADEDL